MRYKRGERNDITSVLYPLESQLQAKPTPHVHPSIFGEVVSAVVELRRKLDKLHQFFKLHAIQNTAPQGPIDKAFELSDVFAKQFRSLMIQRIIWVGLVKQVNEAIDDGINVQHRLPIFS
eukprot:scaffold6807_cov220-Amphora_coffeaeformis.AAC.12